MSKASPTHRVLEEIIAEGCGLDACTTDSATRKRLNYYSVLAMTSANPGWPRPDQTEASIEKVLAAIRDLRKAIESLDNFTRSAARRAADHAYKEAMDDLERAAKANDMQAIEAAQLKLEAQMNRPESSYVDVALLQLMGGFEAALREKAAQVISIAPSGPGRPKNLAAYRLAEVAVRAHLEFTGKKPTFWNGGSTPFSRMMDSLFVALGVRAGTRKPYDAAMLKLCPAE